MLINFSSDIISTLFEEHGFVTKQVGYVLTETINRKEGIRFERIFVQGVFVKQLIKE
jgi:hypothetical protein